MVRRFKELRKRILQQILEMEGFGALDEPIRNRGQFDFPRSNEKVAAFMDWLRQEQQAGGINLVMPETARIGAIDDRWANVYIDTAYQQGIRRGRAELKKQGIDTLDDTDPTQALKGFNNPVHADRVGLAYTRVYSDLNGITAEMDKQISRVLAQGIAEGLNPREMARQIVDRVDKIGITRARALARTETVRAHHQANIQEFKNAGIEEVEVVAEWVTAGDDRVCPICEPLNGKIYTIDAAEGMLPRHPNCFVAGTNIAASKIEATTERRFYGDGVAVRTASGKEFICTPNHPILTNIGWLPAGKLNESHYAVASFLGETMPADIASNYDMITSIEKVADSVWGSGGVTSMKVPISAPDFHGDVPNDDIAIIRANSLLEAGGDSAIDEHIEHLLFKPRIKTPKPLFGVSSFAKLFKAPFYSFGRFMSGFNLRVSLGFAHLAPSKQFRFRLRPDMLIVLIKKTANYVSRYAKMLRRCKFRFSRFIHGDNIDLREIKGVAGSGNDSAFLQSCLDNLVSDPKLASQISDCAPRGVFFDQIIDVNTAPINAHVYNLQTESNAYVAEGIISHNCRCVVVPILREDVDKRKIRAA